MVRAILGDWSTGLGCQGHIRLKIHLETWQRHQSGHRWVKLGRIDFLGSSVYCDLCENYSWVSFSLLHIVGRGTNTGAWRSWQDFTWDAETAWCSFWGETRMWTEAGCSEERCAESNVAAATEGDWDWTITQPCQVVSTATHGHDDDGSEEWFHFFVVLHY